MTIELVVGLPPATIFAAAIGCAGMMAVAAGGSAPRSERVEAALRPFVESHALAGAVALVADKDRVLSLDAVGFSDISGGKAMKADALFWIASQTKPITATALMMLVDAGKLSLDDPVEKYLPEFHGQWLAVEQDDSHMLLKRPRHRITVRNILSHTSGLPFASAMEQPTLDMLPLSIAARSYAMTPLQFEPDSRYQYSNAGINTAGRLVEVLSGMPYEEFLQKRLFDPLGMKDTCFRPNKSQIARLAKSYKPNGDKTDLEETTISQLTYPLENPTRQPMPAGGLFSTAADVVRFCRMILNAGTLDGNRYLSETAVKQMTTRQTGEGIPESYGLGWATGDGSYGHGGAMSTNMAIDARRGLITIWMVQHNGFPKDGDQAQAAFRKVAEQEFSSESR